MSKGSKQRPTDKEKYDVNWERIFGVKPMKNENKKQKKDPDDGDFKKNK